MLFLRPGGLSVNLTDTNHYWSLARWQAAGAYPFFDYWMEYPPIFPWLAVLAYRISLIIPAWQGSNAWFYISYHALLIPFEIGCALLIYALVRRYKEKQAAYEAVTKYAIAVVPLIVFLGFFDTLPLFFILLGLYTLLRRHSVRTGVIVGLGIMVKIFPVVLLPAAWSHLRTYQARISLVLSLAATVAVIGLPGLIANPEMSIASLQSITSRASHQTIWAILEGYHSYGVVSYERFDPGAASWQIHTTSLPNGPIFFVFVAGFAVLYLAWQRTDKIDPRRLIAFVGLALTGLMLWSRGFSPQWMIFQVPFLILLLQGWSSVTYLIALDMVTMLEWGLGYTWMSPYRWFIDGEVVLHTILLLAIGIEYARIALDLRGGWRQTLRIAPKSLLLVVFAGQFALLIRGSAIYRRDHAINEPHAPLAKMI